MKRLADIAGAAFGLVLSSPILAVSALAVWVADRGPVFYRQERVGRGGRPFRIVKFRTMVVDAEHKGLGLAVAVGDDRITAPGRLLRATSIDELPQLWNVLRGDMSLVGPRPTIRSQVERYTAHQARRLEVRPGLTGLAQVSGRNSLSWPERIELDVEYVDRRSLWLDLRILARTPGALLRGRGLYGADGVTPDL